MDNFPAIADMVRRAEAHADEMSKDRLRAIEYYQGKMHDTPASDGRSSMVSRDVRANIKKVLPSIARTILNSDQMAEFLPVGAGDDEKATQATDYMNEVVFTETDVRSVIYDAIHDALLLRNGIIKWWFEEKQCVKISKHGGLTEDALAQFVNDDEVEVTEQNSYEEMVPITGPDGEPVEVPVLMYDIKIRRTFTEREIKCAAVPRERLLIHPDAVTIEGAILAGEKTEITRSDLVAMGYDRKKVESLTLADDDDVEQDARRDASLDAKEGQAANEPIDFYDIYIRVDMDDDGIAELRHMTFAGGLAEKHLLEDDEVDEIQMCDVCVMRQPHQWEGISLADDLMDIQRGKTVLLRETLDNIYWQNKPQPIMQDGAVLNEDAVYNPEFGRTIVTARGVPVKEALGFNHVPFVAKDSFGMMEYLDQEAQDRTGVSDASAGLAPDALQNMTAKASAMIEQTAIGQTEMMVQNVAHGLRRFFRGLLRLSIRHQDVARTVRLRGKWVEVDPRQWDAEMDCKVNTGLGAGTRERDMQMMQLVMGMQEKLLLAFGADNAFVKPEQVYNAGAKMIEAAGLKTTSLYLTEPDPQEVEAALEKERNAPDPEKQKLEAQMQLEQMKMQVNRDREEAQMQADLQVKKAEIQAEQQKQADKLASDAALLDRKLTFEREKFMAEMEFKRAQADRDRQDAIWQHQAAQMENAQNAKAQSGAN